MRVRRDPSDDLMHPADDDPNYNESRYYNFSEPNGLGGEGGGLGGWVRMGNRVNEGYAELTVCLYLPDGQVGFIFKRPHIDHNDAHDAGGLRFEVVSPYAEHHVTYDGQVCMLANPRDMADPGTAFKNNPHVDCTIDLRLVAAAPATGGERIYDEGEEPPAELATSFARGHTEQQMQVTGVVRVDGQEYHLERGLRPARPLVGPAHLAEHLVVPVGHRELPRLRHRRHVARRGGRPHRPPLEWLRVRPPLG